MVMSGLLQITDVGPLVLGNIINFTSFTSFIRILATNGINEIFGLELKLPVEMSQLMTTPRMVHKGFLFYFVGLFVYDVAFIGKDRSNIILFLLPSNEENLILRLNGRKLIWKNISIPHPNLDSTLGIQLMNKERLLLFIIIMQSWFDTGEDVVWFKADHVVQETSEFVYFTFDFDHWSSVFLNKVDVLTNFRFELGVFGLEF